MPEDPLSPDSILLGLPDEWVVLPTDDVAIGAQLNELLRVILDRRDWSPTEKRKLELIVARVRQELTAAEVSLAAMLAGSWAEGDGADQPATVGEGGVLAFCTVAYTTRDELGSLLPLSIDVVMASLELPEPDGSAQPLRRRNLEPVSLTDLPTGPAVRRISLVDYGDATSPVELLEDVFYIPSTDGSGLCILQFSSPTVALARDLSELFAAIASTVQVLYPGDPTPLTPLAT